MMRREKRPLSGTSVAGEAKESSQLSPMITFVWLWKESRKRNVRRERNSFRRECTSSREFKSKRMEDLPEERNGTN